MLIAVAMMAAGCARPVGDFGRAEPSVLHDNINPPRPEGQERGDLRTDMFGRPVSEFNLTDDEREMHDRAWRFLVAAHSRDWYFNILVEAQRQRRKDYINLSVHIPRYYDHLRADKYGSSHVRYARVISDIRADRATMPGVFASICRVEEIDRRRATAAVSVASAGEAQKYNVAARRSENEAYVDWFVRSARMRADSYNYALEQLLLETPHEEARELNAEINHLYILVEAAERNDFCGTITLDGGYSGGAHIASRFENSPFTPDPEFRK